VVVIESLRAVGFRRLKLTESLRLERGLTIVRGPNEAGKSTLIEAILFGLYGDVNLLTSFRKPIAGAGRVTLGDIIAHGARRAMIEVTFRVGDKRYRVYRVIERRRDIVSQVEARLIDAANNRLIAIGVKPVEREVEKIIGVSWKEMLATNVVAQKDLERLIELGSRDREAIINMMMGLESFNKARDRAAEERRELRHQLENVKGELRELQNRLKDLEDIKRQYDEYLDEKRKIEAILPQRKEELRKVSEIVEHLNEVYEYLETKQRLEELSQNLQKHIERLAEERQSTSKDLENLKTKLSEYRNKKKRFEEELNTESRGLKAEREELELLKGVLRELEKLKSAYDAKKQLAIDRQRKLEDLAGELGVRNDVPVEQWVKELESKGEIPKVKLRQLIPSLVAILASISLFLVVGWLALPLAVAGLVALFYTYHRVQSEKLRYATLYAKLDNAKTWEAEVKHYKEEMRQLASLMAKTINKVPGKYRSKLRGSPHEICAQLSTLVEDKERKVAELNRRVGELESMVKELTKRIDETVERVKDLSAKLQRIEKELKEKEEELKRTEERLRSLKKPEPAPELGHVDDLEIVKRLLREYEEKREKLQYEITTLCTKLERCEKFIRENEDKVKSLDDVKRKIGELERRVEELNHRIGVLEIVIKSLSDISRRLRESFAPAVERYMGRIINVITNGRYKAVKIDPQNYDIQVFDAQAGRFLPRNIYSGGANDQFLLAMRIAFTLALLRGAKGTYPRFLFLDEPLGSSDSDRRRRIIQLLSEELTRYFDQILLITHVETPEIPGATIVTIEDGRVQRIRKVSQTAIAEV